ncbi:MAG: hypothetical protein WBV94_11875 [Blastocatellia bacterium]
MSAFPRTYKEGRPTGPWQKGESITSLDQVKSGDLLIMDSHQFEATNLIKVMKFRDPGSGFLYSYAETNGKPYGDPHMSMADYEIGGKWYSLYSAVKRQVNR